MEKQEPRSSHGLGTHLATEEHPLMAAMQNWGANLERKKNSTFSEKRKRLGWDDLSEFVAFSTDVPWCPLEALGPFARAFGSDMRAAA